MHSQVVVLGGGPGGYAAAFLAADLGMEVTIVEADPRLGGTCLLRGCIPSKALLHVAKILSEAEEMADWGVKFSKPKVNIDKVRERKENIIAMLSGGLKKLAEARKVRVIKARGVFVDSTTLNLEGSSEDDSVVGDDRLTFDHCIPRHRERAGNARVPRHWFASCGRFNRRARPGRRSEITSGGWRRLHRTGDGHGLF